MRRGAELWLGRRRGRASAAETEWGAVAGRVLLGPERDLAGRLLLRPERDVAGRVGGRDESSWPGLSSWEEVAKKERETNEQHGQTVALVASPKERDDVESHQKQRCPEASVRRARSVGVTNYGDIVVEQRSP